MTNEEIIIRVKKIIDSITTGVFEYVRQGLFEKHKIIFASYLCFKILEKDGILSG